MLAYFFLASESLVSLFFLYYKVKYIGVIMEVLVFIIIFALAIISHYSDIATEKKFVSKKVDLESLELDRQIASLDSWAASLEQPKNLMFISAKEKAAYLQSSDWKALKKRRLIIANNCCEVCCCKHSLHLHHETYENLTQESINDVKIICSECHQKIHDILGYDRTEYYPIYLLKS